MPPSPTSSLVSSQGVSDFDPLGSDDPLIVYIDYKSPYAFIAKDPTYAIEDQLSCARSRASPPNRLLEFFAVTFTA